MCRLLTLFSMVFLPFFLLFLCVRTVLGHRYLMDDTIKSSEDVEKYLGLRTLALIPVAENGTDAKKKKKKR